MKEDDDTETLCSSNNYKPNISHDIHDKGYHQVHRRKIPRGKFTLEYYETSMHPETRIRNAVTGNRYRDDHPKLKYLVGSRQEDLFFKVTISNGENGNNPIHLYYDNPEQFEKHMFVTVNSDIKEKWYSKNIEARRANKLNSL